MSSVAKDEQRGDAGLTTAAGERQLAMWEIASIVSSLLIAEWIAASVAGGNKFIVAIPITLAFAFMIVSHRLRNETLRDLGFRFDNFLQSGLLLLPPMVLVAALTGEAAPAGRQGPLRMSEGTSTKPSKTPVSAGTLVRFTR